MVLKFLGRGAGFADDHTSAYFVTKNNELVLIDCPVSAFQKLKKMDLASYEKIYVLITHTHGDHIGGLGLFVQYMNFVCRKRVVIVAPSERIASDISTVLSIEGNECSWYNLVTIFSLENKEWFGDCISTKHSMQLDGGCFGYHLIVGNTSIVYTGDTVTLRPFNPFLKEGTELYVDTSVHYGMVHLKLEDVLNDFIKYTKYGVKVYLMHLDDVSAAEKIVANIPDIEIVEVV